MEWPSDLIVGMLSYYGSVVRVEDTRIYQEGRKLPWNTGTRYVYFSNGRKAIPAVLPVDFKGKRLSLSFWYRHEIPCGVRHNRCGSMEHINNECPSVAKVCCICVKDDHFQA